MNAVSDRSDRSVRSVRTLRRLAPAACLFALLAAVPAAGQDRPQVVAELSRSRIYEGESVRYRVVVRNVENPQPPRLEGFDDFTVQLLGENSMDSREVTIINGQMTEAFRFGRSYAYSLLPKRSGVLQIPPPLVDVDGREFRGRSLTLEVVAPQEQDLVLLEISAGRDKVYPLQQFAVRLGIMIRALPEPFTETNPVTVLRDLPALEIPWVDDAGLPDGLQPETGAQRWLDSLQARGRGGFSINNIAAASVFSFFNDGPEAYQPPVRRTTRSDAAGEEATYWEYELVRRFTANKTGQFSFGPVTLKGRFVSEAEASGAARTEDIYAVAQAIVVAVQEPPREGRPESYIHAIGNFTVDSSLAPERARVGDPVTLTVTLRGQGTLDAATAPRLEQLPEIAERFRLYDAAQETRDGVRRFTYNLRPLEAGDLQLPPIPLTYFDVEKEAYVTLQTEPLTILVETAEQLRDDQIAIAADPRNASRTLRARNDGLQANVTSLAALRDQSVQAARWWTLLSGLAVAYVAIVLVTRRVSRLVGDPALRRRLAAPRRARDRLQAALEEIDAGRSRQAAEHLGAALVGLVADVADVSPAGMTSREVDRRLAEWAVDPALRQRLARLLEACDAARYGTSSGVLQGLGDEARQVLDGLIAALRPKRRLT